MLLSSVGNNLTNREDDVRQVKNRLSRAGIFDNRTAPEPHGFITREMDEGIKEFQKSHDLKIDGKLFPGGETENALFGFVARREEDRPSVFDATGRLIRTPDYVPQVPQEDKLDDRFILTAAPVPKKKPEPENKPVEYDATGRLIRPKADTETVPIPQRKPVVAEEMPIPTRKPETISPTQKGNELLDLIGKFEGSDNYNIIVGGSEKPLTKMTVKQVIALQKERKDKKLGTPVGKYQIKDTTLKQTIRRLGINENEVFDKNLQDKMGRQLLKDRGFEDYKAGKITTKELIKELSKEWAALPKDESNESHYKGTGNNKALVDFETVKELLEK